MLAAISRVVLWEMTDDLCLPLDSPFSLEFQIENSTTIGVCQYTYSLFEIDPLGRNDYFSSDLLEVLLVVAVMIIFAVYNQKASYFHSFYQFSLVDAFFKHRRDMSIDELPAKPVLMVRLN